VSIFKSKHSDIELQFCGDRDEDHDFVCYECLLSKDGGPLNDGNVWLGNVIDAANHLREHIAAGHLVPNEAIAWIQRDLNHASIIHQSSMNPGRRFDGSFSGYCENVYHTRWLKENQDDINNRLLINLLREAGLGPVTQRDASVAATIVTWLGTNVGRCFVENCLREIGEWKRNGTPKV
jgi:hypothetical protein